MMITPAAADRLRVDDHSPPEPLTSDELREAAIACAHFGIDRLRPVLDPLADRLRQHAAHIDALEERLG
ncbi:MAG TPA: hypothetical protein VHK88_20060 [Aquihabitans sp.]|jgi:hypothetical protein|nr:hypothetical protein [Aquihabitans sp.]